MSIVLSDSTIVDPQRHASEGVTMMALSPNGELLAIVASQEGRSQLYLRRASDFALRAVAGSEGALSPFFSPSGDAIGFFADSALKVVSLADGHVRTVKNGIDEPWGGAWAPDGRFVLSVLRASRLMVLSATGDSLKYVFCPSACSYPSTLPDGNGVLVGGGASVRRFDMNSGEFTPIARNGEDASAEPLRGFMPQLDGRGHLVYVSLTGQLVVADFAAAENAVTSNGVVIADSVRVESARGAAQFALASGGTIAFATGPELSRGVLVRADRSGALDTIPAPSANYLSIAISPDGRRVAARVRLPSGAFEAQVIDIATGRVTSWLQSPALGRPEWSADGTQLLVLRGGDILIGNPDLSSPPRTLKFSKSFDAMQTTSDSTVFLGFYGDSMWIVHTDGRAPRVFQTPRTGAGAISPDGRWFVAEEVRNGGSSVVARALDGSGRRMIISGRIRLGMAGWAKGGSEFVFGDFIVDSLSRDGRPARQGFWTIPYDPARGDAPFGEPRLLFRAPVADFPGRNYDAGLGGRLFVFKQTPIVPPIREIRVVRHWHSLLSTATRR